MKLVICVVRDVRAAVFLNPFFVQSVGVAVRQFTDEVNRPEESNLLFKHPEDFELFYLGDYDAVEGRFDLKPMVQVAEGNGCVKRPRSPADLQAVS